MDTDRLLRELTIYLLFISTTAIQCPDNLPLDHAFVLPSTGSCYFFSDAKMNFTETQAICEGQAGGHLIFYETASELLYLEIELSDYWNFNGRSYWLGLELVDTVWYWTVFNNPGRIKTTAMSWEFGAIPTEPGPVKAKTNVGWGVVSSSGMYFYPLCEININSNLKFDIQPVEQELTTTDSRLIGTGRSPMNVFQYIGKGTYESERIWEVRSLVECAVMCLDSVDCTGIVFDRELTRECLHLYIVQTTIPNIDCRNEKCFFKVI